jgi:hypothetical protein
MKGLMDKVLVPMRKEKSKAKMAMGTDMHQ